MDAGETSSNAAMCSKSTSDASSRSDRTLPQICTSTRVNWCVYLLVILFGLGSWIAVNGIWVELPLLVDVAPESWDLPSYLVVIIQLANIGPLFYSVGSRHFPRVITEKCTILFIIGIGFASCILLALFWDRTSVIAGVQHSTALIALTFCLATADCTSSVVFLTFMAFFEPVYMSALYVGEALCSLLPAIVALIQGSHHSKCSNSTENLNNTVATASFHVQSVNLTTGQNKVAYTSFDRDTPTGLLFGPSEFFIFLSVMMALCGLSFVTLNWLTVRKHKRTVRLQGRVRSSSEYTSVSSVSVDEDSVNSSVPDLNGTDIYQSVDDDINLSTHFRPVTSIGRKQMIYLLCIQAWINCLNNGVLPSIQSFACEPYGENAYHLVATLSPVMSTVTCFVAVWLNTSSAILLSLYSVFYTIISTFIVILASSSPDPPMRGQTVGAVMVVTLSVLNSMFASYIKLGISTIMRKDGRKALFWCGVSTQIGSCVGALTIFPLVNVVKLFKKGSSC